MLFQNARHVKLVYLGLDGLFERVSVFYAEPKVPVGGLEAAAYPLRLLVALYGKLVI